MPAQWNSSIIINMDKGNKGGISLNKNTGKLLEKNYHQQSKQPSTIYRSTSRSSTREKHTVQLVSFEICNTTEMI